jgi:argininosuccinate synthase
LIAKRLVEIARIEGASAIAHGGTAKGNNQVRIEVAVRTLEPTLEVLAPARSWGLSRSEELDYARKRGIPVPVTDDKLYSVDANLWGRSIKCGVLDDPWQEAPEDIFTITKAPADAPDTPAYVEIEFVRGVPVAINGVSMTPAELIASLETIAGGHGIGRIDIVENRLVGIKSREVYEAPAAVVLHAAHADLQRLVTSRELDRITTDLGVKYADLIYNGLWFSAAREAIDALVAKVQERVTGNVRVKLFKGECRVVGRTSPHSLYDVTLATYERGDAFDHTAAEGL